MAEMPFRCKQAFPREEKCLLDLLRSVLQSFIMKVILKYKLQSERVERI
jgi:hypothetical protein